MGLYEDTMKIVEANSKNKAYQMALDYDKAIEKNEIFRKTMDMVKNPASFSQPAQSNYTPAAAKPAFSAPAVPAAPKPDKSAIQAQNYNRLMNMAAGNNFTAKAAQRAQAGELASGRDFVMGSAPSSFGTERVDYGVKSIGQGIIGAVPQIATTAKQAGQDFAANIQNPEWRAAAAKKIKGEILGEVDQFGINRGVSQETNDALREVSQDTPVDPNSFGARMLKSARESQERALAGLNPTERLIGSSLISVGQNAAMLPTALINPAAPLVGMGAIASADKMYELSERGIGAGEAFTRGVVSGAIEAATEKIPLDNMLTMLKSASGREVIKNILRQMGTEAGEEAVSYIANYVADKAANDPQASFSPSELAQAAAAGAISGGIMGGAGTAIGTLRSGGAEKIYALTEQKLQENAPQAETPVKNTVNSQTIGNIQQAKKESTFKNYLNQIAETMKGTFSRNQIIVGETPDILQNYGAQPRTVTLNQSDIRKIAYPTGYMGGKHNLGFHALEMLPQQLENPVAILKSSSQPNSLVIFTELLDAENNPVMVAMHLDKNGQLGLTNHIASVYGRGNFENFISKERAAGNLLYESKEKDLSQLPAIGLQLPKVEAKIDPMNSKAQTAPTVNTQDMPNDGEVMQSKPLPEPLMDSIYRLAEQGHNDFTRGGVEVAQGEKTGAYIQRKMREYGVSNENDLVARMSAEDYAAYNERLAEEAAEDDEARIESLMYDMDQQEMARRLRAAAQAPKNTAEMLTDIDSGIIANDNINDDYKLLANVHFAGNKTLRENLDAAVKGAKGDLPLSEKERFRLRQWLYETFEKPLAESKAKYTKNIKIKAEGFAADMKRLGIKAGSKESAAVQWIGEGQIQDPDGEITEYTLDDLKRDFPQNWQKINEAAQICRRIYDNYVNEINDALKLVYPNVEAKAAETLAGFNNRAAQYNANANVWEQTAVELTEQAQQLMRDSQYMIGIEKARLVTQAQQLEQEAQKVLNRSQWHRKMADNSDQKAAELGRQIESGEILRNKRLMPRKDYFHHFNEMEQGLGGFINIISGSHDISPQLVGKSDFTKPKSKWWGALQHRAGGKYTADAVSGMAKYIPAAEYKIAFDPYIAKMRGNIEAMVRSTEKTKNANSLIEFLTDWTNDLAGKTNPYDRSLQKALGRKPMKALEWLNNRAKANAVMGNLGSALVQIGNIPNAMMLVKGPAHWLKAANDLFTFNGKDGQSVFLAERYINNTLDQLQNRSIITKGADGMMELGDRWAARLIWNAAYNQFESGFAKTNRRYESAVEYADDITRRAIGGRGIGELPLTQKARVVKLFAPFQVEVNNTFNLLAEQIGEKNALGLLNFALGSWLINSLLFWMTGRRPLFDPIDAIKDAIMGFMDEDEEKKRTTLEKGADAVKRLGGEVIANAPYAATAATFLVGKENSEKIFGENDPTRYGTGNIAIQSIAKPVGQFLDGQNVDLVAPLATFIPAYGGKQIERGIRGAQALGYLPRIEANVKNEKLLNVETNPFGMSRSASGQIRFPITSPADQIKTIALGEWSTNRAKDYLAEGMQPLSDPATEAMIEAFASGITPDDFYDAYRAMQKAKSDKDEKGETIRGSKKENQKELVRLAVPHLTTAQRMKLYVALGIEKEDKKK